MTPDGWISPYSSLTENAALATSTPDPVSVIVPEMVTGTIAAFGGHKTLGAAAAVTTGGTASAGTVSFSSTLTEPIGKGAAPTTRSARRSPLTSVARTRTEAAVVL